MINYEHLLSIKKDEEPTRPPTTTPAPTNATLAKERLAAINYENYRLNSEKKQRDLQDLDQHKYTIRHALPKCQNSHASVVQQVEEKCVAEEPLSGYELPGTQHFYCLSQLEPETHYRITIRACVEGVVNGCSTPAEAVIKTASIQLERFIKGV